MRKHQQWFGLDVKFSALVHNFNNTFSNGHLYRAGQSMNSLPSQIFERWLLFWTDTQRKQNINIMRPFIFFLLLTLFFLPLTTIAQQDSIDVFITNQMKQQGIIGLSIGIVKNGKVIKAKGYGQANIELNIPASEKTVYKIGSISKQFIAIGIMKLVQEGKLKII
jgi:hypothetical protein